MQINLKPIKIREIFAGYKDRGDDGVVGYHGKLDIRPPYQREFIYKDAQRNAVISTVRRGFPLNVLYWSVNKADRFEVMDGQQRTLSICQYIAGDFSCSKDPNPKRSDDKWFFHGLTPEEQEQILEYELMIYLCDGTEREKLDWFEVVNIAGEKLTPQELRNIAYTGPWLSSAKQFFSKANGPAFKAGKNFMTGSPIRQEYLETVIKWIVSGDDRYKDIRDYMAFHQKDDNAEELKTYFISVIEWAQKLFNVDRKERKNVEWGVLYNTHKNGDYDANKLEEQVAELMADEDVTKKSGIYPYLITGDKHYLNMRVFTEKQKREAYERQNGVCAITKKKMSIEDMEADHIIPWSQGGKTTSENCQMVSKLANRRKSDS